MFYMFSRVFKYVSSMFQVCFSYVSRVFKYFHVFSKCFSNVFLCGPGLVLGDWDVGRRRRRDVYPTRPAARAAEPHARRARHHERAQGGEGHRAHLCDPPRGSRWRRRAWLWKYFENTWNILEIENILEIYLRSYLETDYHTFISVVIIVIYILIIRK